MLTCLLPVERSSRSVKWVLKPNAKLAITEHFSDLHSIGHCIIFLPNTPCFEMTKNLEEYFSRCVLRTSQMSFFIALKFLFLMLSFISRTLCFAIIHLSYLLRGQKKKCFSDKRRKKSQNRGRVWQWRQFTPRRAIQIKLETVLNKSWNSEHLRSIALRGNVIAIPTRNHVDKRGKKFSGLGPF